MEVPILLLTSVHTLAVKYWDSLLEMSAVKSIKWFFMCSIIIAISSIYSSKQMDKSIN